MTNRILVTGASGFIGRHAVLALIERGFEVVAIGSQASPPLAERAHYIQCDLSHPESLARVVADVQASHLLHMAWRSVAGGLWTARENLDWLKISLRLAETFIAAGGSRVTMSGSCAEYDWSSGLCREDTTLLNPDTYYGQCKLALYSAVRGLCAANNVEFAWGRAFFVYGPGEHPSRLGASIVMSLLRGEEALCSHGMQLRDYLHSKDVGRGLAALAASDLNGAFNLAAGEAIRVKDLIHEIAMVLDRVDLVRLGARGAPAYEPPLIVADMQKTRASTLDWSPEFTLQSGVVDVVDSFRSGSSI